MATPTIGGSPDPSQIANTTNSLIRDVQGMQDVQVFKDDTGTRRVLMGRGPSGFYGMKVSQEGNDVYDATADQLVFNSDNNLFKIVLRGEYILTGSYDGGVSTTTTITIPHGLDYPPIALVYFQNQYGAQPLPYFTGWGITATQLEFSGFWKHSTDDTNLYIEHNFASGSSGTYNDTFVYYIVQETAS